MHYTFLFGYLFLLCLYFCGIFVQTEETDLGEEKNSSIMVFYQNKNESLIF